MKMLASRPGRVMIPGSGQDLGFAFLTESTEPGLETGTVAVAQMEPPAKAPFALFRPSGRALQSHWSPSSREALSPRDRIRASRVICRVGRSRACRASFSRFSSPGEPWKRMALASRDQARGAEKKGLQGFRRFPGRKYIPGGWTVSRPYKASIRSGEATHRVFPSSRKHRP